MDERKREATFDDVAQFSFEGIKQEVKVVKVVDGDTCHVVADYKGELIRLKCKLKYIDCAELKQGSLDIEGRDGYVARDFLAHLCCGSYQSTFQEKNRCMTREELERKLEENHTLIYAIFGKFDSFGRVLATLKTTKNSRKSFSQILKDGGFSKDVRERNTRFPR